MEKPLFPSKHMRITQGYDEGTHVDSFAIDNAGKNSSIENIYAPFTGIIKKIYQNDANEVWLESIDKVEYPDGTLDYMTIMFAHDNDVTDLFVGKRINRGEVFYHEGTKGNASGNHCHIECGLGKFTGTGWYKNNGGYYSINNRKKPEECLWIDNSITIMESYGYNWKTIEKISTEPVEKEEPKPIEPLPPTPIEEPPKENTNTQNNKTVKFEYSCEKDGLYGVYLNKGEVLYIE